MPTPDILPSFLIMPKWNPFKFLPENIELLQRPIKDNFCSSEEASKLIGVSVKQVHNLITSGWLYGSFKMGNTWLVCRASLDAYIEKRIQDRKIKVEE